MFKNLSLRKPLAVIDLETTGKDPKSDRIVEIGILKVLPNGRQARKVVRVNPEMPIPADATRVHKIRDEDVADEPTFREVAGDLLAFLDGCDLAGFNLKRFDLRVLYAECQRAGMPLPLERRAVVDAMEIFHAFEKRDLTAAVRFYLDRDHDEAHSAGADALATAEVLDAMLARYDELPRTPAGLQQHFQDPNTVDANGRFVRTNGAIRFTFGKHRGQPLAEVARLNPDYLEWMLSQDFLDDAKAVVRQALAECATATVS